MLVDGFRKLEYLKKHSTFIVRLPTCPPACAQRCCVTLSSGAITPISMWPFLQWLFPLRASALSTWVMSSFVAERQSFHPVASPTYELYETQALPHTHLRTMTVSLMC